MSRGTGLRRWAFLVLVAGLAGCAGEPGVLFDGNGDGGDAEQRGTGDETEQALRAAAQKARRGGDFAGAAVQFRKLAARNPDKPDPAVAAMRMLRYAGRAATAARFGERVVDRFPDNADVRLALGKAYVADDRARTALRHLGRLGGDERWGVPATRGIAHDLLGNHAKAQAAYKRALAMKPGNAEVLNNLGLSHALAGDLEKGRATLRRALSHARGNDTRIRQNLALLAALGGEHEAAERYSPKGLPEDLRRHNRALYRKLARVHGAPAGETPERDAAESAAPETAPKAPETRKGGPAESGGTPESGDSDAGAPDAADGRGGGVPPDPQAAPARPDAESGDAPATPPLPRDRPDRAPVAPVKPAEAPASPGAELPPRLMVGGVPARELVRGGDGPEKADAGRDEAGAVLPRLTVGGVPATALVGGGKESAAGTDGQAPSEKPRTDAEATLPRLFFNGVPATVYSGVAG